MSALVRRSFVGCPAPSLALGLRWCGRRLVRSLVGCVCVRSRLSWRRCVLLRLRLASSSGLVPSASFVLLSRRWRVSVPCLSPAMVVRVCLGRPRLARRFGGRLVLAS